MNMFRYDRTQVRIFGTFHLKLIVQIPGQPDGPQEILLSGEIRGGQPRVQLEGGGRGGQPPDCDSGGRAGGDGHT